MTELSWRDLQVTLVVSMWKLNGVFSIAVCLLKTGERLPEKQTIKQTKLRKELPK